jgi:hypothetical protein
MTFFVEICKASVNNDNNDDYTTFSFSVGEKALNP